MERKKSAVIVGLCMGLCVAAGSMALSSRDAGATILVFDQKNTEQAIKEAMQTYEILKKSIEQVKLGNLNTQSLDYQRLQQWLNRQKKNDQQIMSGDAVALPGVLNSGGQSVSILNRHTTTTSVLKNEIGTIEDVIHGKIGIKEAYKQSVRNKKALDASYKAAAQAAQNVQKADASLSQSVNEAAAAAANAQGQKEVQQAGVAIAAANAMQTHNGNELLANILAIKVEEAYAKNLERAQKHKAEQDSKDNIKKFASSL